MRRVRGTVLGAAVALAACFVAPTAAAGAPVSVVPQGFPQGFSAETSTTQAGAPADSITSFALTVDSPTPWPGVDLSAGETSGLLRDAIVELPSGFNGNAFAVPQCGELLSFSSCPANTQVGVVDVKAVTIFAPDFQLANRIALPLYNLTPTFGEAARLGAFSSEISMQLSVTLRPDGSGVQVATRRVTNAFPVVSATLTIWGLPGDPVHDGQRCPLLSPLPLSDDFETVPFCDAASGDPNQQPQSFEGERRPFFINPTSCGSPRLTSISVSGWADPTHFATEQATAPPTTGCDQLGFEPSVSVATDTHAPDAPTGLELELTVPESGG